MVWKKGFVELVKASRPMTSSVLMSGLCSYKTPTYGTKIAEISICLILLIQET
jgi:hypothetical protein